MTPAETLAALRAPFPPDAISWRVGSTTADKTKGMALGYVDARDVMRRLDEVMGLDWECRYIPMPNGSCCCEITLHIDGKARTRSNGAHSLPDRDKVEAKEMAEKASYSEAFKRAAVLFGIGQYLYDLPNVWVALKASGHSHVIADSEMPKLRAALARAAGASAPQWTGKAPQSTVADNEPNAGPASAAPTAWGASPGASTADDQPSVPRSQSISARASANVQRPGNSLPDPKGEALARGEAAAKKAADLKDAASFEIRTHLVSLLTALVPGSTHFDAGWAKFEAAKVKSFRQLTVSDQQIVNKAILKRKDQHAGELAKQKAEAA